MKKLGVLIDISTACPHGCVYCFHQRKRIVKPEFMDEYDFEQIISILDKEQFKRIHLYMSGEPTLHPSFPDFLACAGILGFDVTVATKAGLVMNWDRIKKAQLEFAGNSGSLRWLIEVPGWDIESISKICFIDRETEIQNLLQFGEMARSGEWKNISWKTVTIVTRWNECDLNKIRRWLASIGLKVWSVKRPGYFIDKIKGDDWLPSEQFARRLKTDRTKCPFPNNVAINVHGNVTVCCHDMLFKINLGNVAKEGSLQRILDKNKKIMNRRLAMGLKICRKCN